MHCKRHFEPTKVSGSVGAGRSLPDLLPEPRIVDRGQVQYALMDLTPLDRREYYSGFANRALWPTMHYRIGLSDFSRADYNGYLRVNRRSRALSHGLSASMISFGFTTTT